MARPVFAAMGPDVGAVVVGELRPGNAADDRLHFALAAGMLALGRALGRRGDTLHSDGRATSATTQVPRRSDIG